MLGTLLRTLRQPRYAALGVLMIFVALVCVGAGTWQIFRFEQKRHENDYLRVNAHVPTAPVGSLLPVVGAGTPSTRAVQFRQVRVAGSYDLAGQTLVRSRTLGDATGYLVVTPLRTAGPTLLVVRGFMTQPDNGDLPPIPAPPAGPVTVTARLSAGETRDDRYASLTQHQVESINPAEQAARLGGPLYNGFAQLEAHQAGTSGLQALPPPDLSNPAGGALEPQHFAYIIQWYLFAVLALAAPVVMARSEMKAQGGVPAPPDPFAESWDESSAAAPIEYSPTPDELRAAKLADRYGRAARS